MVKSSLVRSRTVSFFRVRGGETLTTLTPVVVLHPGLVRCMPGTTRTPLCRNWRLEWCVWCVVPRSHNELE